MATINFVGGEVGGAGKSTFCMLLIEAFTLYEIPYHFRDADRSTPNVGWAYDAEHYMKGVTNSTLKGNYDDDSEWKPVIFSEDFDDFAKADTLIDLAGERDVIVNLPAQVSCSFDKWMDAGDFLTVQGELGIQFVYWWVSRPEQRSIDLLLEHAALHGSALPHILVRNQHRRGGNSWDGFFDEDMRLALTNLGIRYIDMPEFKLMPEERAIFDRENPTISGMLLDSRFGRSFKPRCDKFLRTAIDAIKSTDMLPVAVGE